MLRDRFQISYSYFTSSFGVFSKDTAHQNSEMKRLYISYVFLILTSIIFCFSDCINNSGVEKRYCGIVMKPGEILHARNKEKNFEYSDNDMNIHSEIAYFAQKIGGDSIIVDINLE